MLQFDQLPAAAANHKTELNCHQVFVEKSAKGLWGAEWTKYCMAHLSACKEEDI